MSKLVEYRIDITTNSSGDSTDTSEAPIFGRLYAVDVVDGTLADNFDITVSYTSAAGVSKTLVTFTNLTADGTYYPRHLVHSEAAAALTGTAGGDRELPLVAGKITAVTAQGGNVASGSLLIYVFENE